MVSSTQQFDRIRKRKATSNGKRNKRERRANGTPKFPVHQAGYDLSAADAKKPALAKALKPIAKKPVAKKATKTAK